MNKADIATKFKELEKLGYKVLNFGDNRRTRIASKDMTDLLIVGHGCVHFAEIKIISTKDRFYEGQKKFAEKLKLAERKNSKVFYWVVTENNCKTIINNIILLPGC